MTSLAVQLVSRLQKLDEETLKEVETVIFDVLTLAERTARVRVEPISPKPYSAQPQALGLREGLSYENTGELLAALEGENWK